MKVAPRGSGRGVSKKTAQESRRGGEKENYLEEGERPALCKGGRKEKRGNPTNDLQRNSLKRGKERPAEVREKVAAFIHTGRPWKEFSKG